MKRFSFLRKYLGKGARVLFKRQNPLKLSPSDCFRALYERQPNLKEWFVLQRLPLTTPAVASQFRAIIGQFDRQALNTPFMVRFTEQDIEFVDLGEYELAVDCTDVAISHTLQAGRPYEPHLTQFVRQHLKRGMTAVDVGANIGYFTLLAAYLVGETGRVFAFEPNSENCRLILLSIAQNQYKNIELHPIGLSNQRGYAYFSTHLGTNGGLLAAQEDVLLSAGCSVIPIARLDDYVSGQVNLIKMDVEGAEGLVLEGAKQTIQRCRPIVTSEFSFEMLPRVSGVSGKAYLEYFQQLNYDLYVISRKTSELIEISDIDAFLEHYGQSTRIEDLAFLPR